MTSINSKFPKKRRSSWASYLVLSVGGNRMKTSVNRVRVEVNVFPLALFTFQECVTRLICLLAGGGFWTGFLSSDG